MKLFNKKFYVNFLTLLVAALFIGFHCYAEIPNEDEPDYAEAIIKFQTNQYDQSLSLLKNLHQKLSKSYEVLELIALNYRATKQDKEAAKVYKNLIDLKVKDGKQKKEIAPYTFELGMIRFNEKEYEKAIGFFQYSEKENFNVELSKFYIANSYFNLKFEEKSKKVFEEVLQMDFNEIKPAVHFYLGQIYFRNEKQNKGLKELADAKNTSTEIIENNEIPESSKSISRQIIAAVDQVLKPIDKSQWFFNSSLLFGYDSNVLLTPTGTSTSASDKASLKGTLNAGLGYATSPLKESQWVPNLRFSSNQNKNKDTQSGEFTDITGNLIYTHGPLDTNGWGARTEVGALSQSGTGLFSKSVGLGPNLKWALGENFVSSMEYYGKYSYYEADKDLTFSQRRSGILHDLKLTGADLKKRNLWNPVYTLKASFTNTKGTEYRNKIFAFNLSNSQKRETWSFGESIDYSRSLYSLSSNDRKDSTTTLSISANKKITRIIQWVTNLDYTLNRSTDSTTYTYNRFTINSGISLTL